MAENSHSPTKVSARQVNSHSRRRNTHKKMESKTKQILKAPLQTDSYFFLLARKINSLLREKDGLEGPQRKVISSSLAKQVLSGGVE